MVSSSAEVVTVFPGALFVQLANSPPDRVKVTVPVADVSTRWVKGFMI